MSTTYTQKDLDAAYQRGVATAEKLWQKALFSMLDEGMVKMHCWQCRFCSTRYTIDLTREHPKVMLCPICLENNEPAIGTLTEVNRAVRVTRAEVETITRAISDLVRPLQLLRQGLDSNPVIQGRPFVAAQSLPFFKDVMTALQRVEELLSSGWQSYGSVMKLDALPELKNHIVDVEPYDPTKMKSSDN